MSLLSSPQGAPERVWTLVRLLAAHGGSLPREEVLGWLDPFGNSKSASGETLQAGMSLRLLGVRDGIVSLIETAPKSIDTFADKVHERLASTPPDDADVVMFEAMAWLVASIEKHAGTVWLKGRTVPQLADEIDAGLSGTSAESGDRRFNKTKFPPWKRWIEFTGLGFDTKIIGFHPAIARRLRRELAILESNARIEADEFLRILARRMPYIDGGVIYEAAVDRLKVTRSPPRLSRVLSTALRELDDDGVLKLETLGDAANAATLAADTHRVKGFLAVRITRGTQ